MVYNIGDLIIKLERFKPVTSQVIILTNKRLDSVSTVNPTIIQQMRDTILKQIEAVKESPAAVNQAKQVFQGVNTLINLAKTELEYRKYIDELEQNK